MLYDPDEFLFLCAFLDALRDALRRRPRYQNGSAHYAELAQAVREGNLSRDQLVQIKEALILGTYLDPFLPSCQTTESIQVLRIKTLVHTIRLLNEAAP